MGDEDVDWIERDEVERKKEYKEIRSKFEEALYSDVFDEHSKRAIDKFFPYLQKYSSETTNGSYTYEDVILEAVAGGNLDLIKYLFSLDFDTHFKRTGLENAIFANDFPVVETIFQSGFPFRGEDIQIVVNAIDSIEDSLEMVEYLLDRGADPNEYNGTPLWKAIYSNNFDLAELLLRYGATIDLRHLEEAAENNNLEMLKFLEAHGGDIMQEKVMEAAIWNENVEIIEYLKQAREILASRRKKAANDIYKNLLHAHYRPDSQGYHQAMEDFEQRRSQL